MHDASYAQTNVKRAKRDYGAEASAKPAKPAFQVKSCVYVRVCQTVGIKTKAGTDSTL